MGKLGGDSRKEDSISFVSQQAIGELQAIHDQQESTDRVGVGKAIAKRLRCADRDDVAYAVEVIGGDLASLRERPEFLSFGSMLSVIAIIIAITAMIPSLKSVLPSDSSSVPIYVTFAVAILVFGALLLAQSVRQWTWPRKRSGVVSRIEEAKDCLVAYYFNGKGEGKVKRPATLGARANKRK